MVNLCGFMFFYWFPGKKSEESYEQLEDEKDTQMNEFDNEIIVEEKCIQTTEETTYYKAQRLFISSLYTILFLTYFVMAGIGIGLVWIYGPGKESPAGVYARSLGLIATMIIIVQWTPQMFGAEFFFF